MLNVRTFTYTGDASTPRNITIDGIIDPTGAGINTLVLISNADSLRPKIIKYSGMVADESKQIGVSATVVTDAIIAFISTGITIDSTNYVNENNDTFYGLLIQGDDQHTDIMTWVGNQTDRDITTLWQPTFCTIGGNSATRVFMRTDGYAVGESSTYISTAYSNLQIEEFKAAAINIGTGTSVNKIGDDYWAFCIRDHYKHFGTFNYTGDASDPKTVSVNLDKPDVSLIKGDIAETGVWSASIMGSDNSSLFTSHANAADRIQTFNDAATIAIGGDADVNSNGDDYNGIALRIGKTQKAA